MRSRITPGLQEYLTAIYKLQKGNNRAVRAKELAEELGVTLPSVTDALRKLSEAGLINYRRYNEVSLTDAGEKSALLILDKETIFYDFLRNILGIEEELAKEEACWIEHGVSWESAERLRLFIEFLRENIGNINLRFRKFIEERGYK
ncbi:MAG: metal-dependent transcriptional regulator [Candidatus Korarchaeum sp.]